MEHSESITEIATALAKFQGEVKDPLRDENNPFFKKPYVTLDALLQAVRPVLAKNGLSFIQFPSVESGEVNVTTLIMHASGQYIQSEPLVLKPQKTDPQGIGSAITYGRRYSLAALLGIGCDKDDDGNEASQANKSSQHSQQTQSHQQEAKPRQTAKQTQKNNTEPPQQGTLNRNKLMLSVVGFFRNADNQPFESDILKKHFGTDDINKLTIENLDECY